MSRSIWLVSEPLILGARTAQAGVPQEIGARLVVKSLVLPI
jgi:hypothetical protein